MKLKFIFIGLCISAVLSAQDFIMKKDLADHYYSIFDYYRAIPMYEQLLKSYPKNFQVCEKLADSYRRVNDSQNAERCYALLMDSSYVNPDFKLCYAQALARNGKYNDAKEWYEKYAVDKPDDPRGALFAKAYSDIKQFSADSSAYVIHKVAFNSDKSDFSPAYFHNGVVFASARRNTGLIKVWYNWTHTSYLDLFFSYPDSMKVKPFSGAINSKYHEGPLTFSPGQDTVIFTRSNYYKLRFRKGTDGINKLKLYQARYDKALGKWVDITPLPFNSDQYSVGHPTLSKLGHILYFVSDMPGGYGGTDIYVSRLMSDSQGKTYWGNPENLGSEINSPGNEMFPYVDDDGNLWFASNGLPGLGGMDIFVAKANKGFAAPRNLGSPVNSRFDDFGVISTNGGREGLFTSDRYAEPGNDDIYQFTLNKLALRGVVRDSLNGNLPLEKAQVSLVLADGTVAGNMETNASGNFEFPLAFDKTYLLKVAKSGYVPQSKSLTTVGAKAGFVQKDFSIEKAKSVMMFGTTMDKKSGEKLSDVEVYIIDTVSKTMILDTITASDGNFRKALGKVKLNDQLGYRVVLNRKGYLSKNISLKLKVTSMEIDLNNYMEVAMDKIDVGTDIGKLLHINPIYFDLGKWTIRPDAAMELNKVVQAMIDNPGLVIELGAHTDARGSSQSNMMISEKRAKASADYIVSKGIDKSRIYGKGYGETMLINRCADGVQCSEEEHAANRRTEFKIVKF